MDAKLKGESVPIVSASAITSLMKNHTAAYMVFAQEVIAVNDKEYVLDAKLKGEFFPIGLAFPTIL